MLKEKLTVITSDDDGDDGAASVEDFKRARGSPATGVATWLHTAHGRRISSSKLLIALGNCLNREKIAIIAIFTKEDCIKSH